MWGRLAACGGLVTRLRRLATGAQLDKLPHNGTLAPGHVPSATGAPSRADAIMARQPSVARAPS